MKVVVGLSVRIRHVAAWIACFAILLAALAPTISRIIAATCDSPSLTVDLCATGITATSHESGHDDHHSSAPAKKAMHFEHCPFCVTHAGSFGLMPTDAFALPAPEAGHIHPSLFYRSPAPLFAWVSPQSRAPPPLA